MRIILLRIIFAPLVLLLALANLAGAESPKMGAAEHDGGTAARVPAHTPEWSNPNVGDPGVTKSVPRASQPGKFKQRVGEEATDATRAPTKKPSE